MAGNPGKSAAPKGGGGKVRIAVLVGGKVDEIVEHRLGVRELRRDCERLVEIGNRPDIVVGTTWPFTDWDEYQEGLKPKAPETGKGA